MKAKALLLAGILFLVPIIALADKYQDAASTVYLELIEAGFTCTVEVVDMDHNGILDFKVDFISGKGSISLFEAFLTASVANHTMDSDWKSDKVFITFKNKPKFWATTADCRKCRKISSENADDPQLVEKLSSCVLSIWKEVD